MRQLLALVLVVLCLGSPAAALRVVVISDLNGSYGSTDYDTEVHAAIARIIDMAPDLVISTGDMVAGQRRPLLTETEVRAMWRGFHAAVTAPLAEAGIPFLVTPGNHDGSAYAGFEREREIFREEWSLRVPPFPVEGDWPFRYAADVGGIRFVSLDVTTVGRLAGGQMDWLATQETSATTIVFSHLPIHPFAIGRETDIIGDPALEDLLERMGVDAFLSGHHHTFWAGSGDDVAYVTQAGLGGGSRRLVGADATSPKAITVLDIDQTGVSVSALAEPDFLGRIAFETLPARIGGLARLDLAPTQTVRASR